MQFWKLQGKVLWQRVPAGAGLWCSQDPTHAQQGVACTGNDYSGLIAPIVHGQLVHECEYREETILRKSKGLHDRPDAVL
jgi:hypothetical protein